MNRPAIPAALERAVLVEAGHRCAIPTCRATTTEIAHIVPWEKVQEHAFDNLIALCPNCHTRFDQKKEIDRKAIRMYKQNLALLNNRYGEFERRLFSILAKSGERVFIVGAGGDILVANAVLDGLFKDQNIQGLGMNLDGVVDGISIKKNLPMSFAYLVTAKGVEFLKRYAEGENLE